MDFYMNENETVVFEDYDLKVIRHYSDSDSSSTVSDVQSDVEYTNCDALVRNLQEHFLYTENGFFDRLTFTELEEYIGNIDEYEYFDEITFDNLGGSRKKPVTFHFWVLTHYEKLKESYAYLGRLMRMKNMQNNTFYRFCDLGYRTSTSATTNKLL